MSIGGQAPAPFTDEELASRYQATGDPDYFAQIFARHRSLVFSACRRFFGSAAPAEDATQETFLRAYQAIHRFQEGNLCGWLMRIAKNVCIDSYRKRRPEGSALEIASVASPEPVSLERRTDLSLALQKVYKEMESLTPEQRRCVELKMDGFSYEETAKRTGLSLADVKSHLQNGRRMLWIRVEGILSQLP